MIMGPDRVRPDRLLHGLPAGQGGSGAAGDPLAVLLITGRPGQNRTEKRYCCIMHSARWRVANCEYPYEESIAASSDHSAVIADYEPR